MLEKQPTYASDLGAAMRTAFLGVDELLEDKTHLPEIESYKEGAGDGDDADGPPSGGGGGGGGRRIPLSDALSMLQARRLRRCDLAMRYRPRLSRACALSVSPSQSMVLARKNAEGRAKGRGGGAGSGEGSGEVSAKGGDDDDDDDDAEKEKVCDDAAEAEGTAAEPGGAEAEAEAGGAADGSSRVCTLPNSHVMAGCTAVVASVRIAPCLRLRISAAFWRHAAAGARLSAPRGQRGRLARCHMHRRVRAVRMVDLVRSIMLA